MRNTKKQNKKNIKYIINRCIYTHFYYVDVIYVIQLYGHLPSECTYVKITYFLTGNIYGNITTIDGLRQNMYILHLCMESTENNMGNK